jgi:hypothetical protein
MFGLLNSAQVPSPAPAGESDRVVPFRYFDDAPHWRAFILYTLFAYDEVLDAQHLADALARLVKRRGWERFGARLRRNAQGGLEYHVPAVWTDERPPCTFTHVQNATSISEDPVARKLPLRHSSDVPQTVADPDEYLELMRPAAGSPSKLDDYVRSDLPQIGLHIITYTDATLVSIYYPHTLMDAMGTHAFLNAWQLALAGRDNDIPTPIEGDPLAALGSDASAAGKHKLAHQRMSMLGLGLYGVQQVPSLLRKNECRMVRLPGAHLSKMRRDALVELARDFHDPLNKEQPPPFVTEGDVLVAWWARIACTAAGILPDSDRLVVINNAFSFRKTVEGELLPRDAPYVSNAVSFVYVLVTARDIFSLSIARLAARIRQSMMDLRTRGQLEAFAAITKESSARMVPIFGSTGMHMLTFTNWKQADTFGTDLAGARPLGSKNAGPCLPKYVQNNQLGFTLPNAFPIVGQDADGSYWMSGYMKPGHWAIIDDVLAQEMRS